MFAKNTIDIAKTAVACLAICSLEACSKKSVDTPTEQPIDINNTQVVTKEFVTYNIKQGSHNSVTNIYKPVSVSQQNFVVVFDSSAIYSTVNPGNQIDVNKLYGFADNDAMHHSFSARIGWNWLNGALWLYGYTYNNGILTFERITNIELNKEVNCNIQVNATSYTFTVNGVTIHMPRTSKTPIAKGYQLYPYFGGDETAPQDIKIKIKEL